MHGPRPRPPTRRRGFTLIELAIAMVVLAILAAVALPTFTGSIRKSRRSDAFAALTAVQQAQERWRNNHGAYAPDSLLATAAPGGLGQSATSSSGYYGIAITSADATDYVLTATAVSGKSQAQDANCQVMAMRMQGGNLDYGSGASSAAYPDASNCWAK
ncbi:MAG: hypothetical protein ABT20_15140 [Rubrivivax sp. SCN 70-15]|nr:MAG: hypothetical protein ABT20_15140 [Rubrivivax sp. SCN 70-15]